MRYGSTASGCCWSSPPTPGPRLIRMPSPRTNPFPSMPDAARCSTHSSPTRSRRETNHRSSPGPSSLRPPTRARSFDTRQGRSRAAWPSCVATRPRPCSTSRSARSTDSTSRQVPRWSRPCSKQPPLIGDPLERPRPAVLERDAGTGDEVADRARHEHLAGSGQGSDARGDVDGDAADVVAHQLDLAGVDPDPHLQPRRACNLSDCVPAADRARGPVEGRETAVAQRLDLVAAEPRQLALNGRLVGLDALAPAGFPELRRPFPGAHPTRLHHRCEHAIHVRRRALADQELLDLAEDRVRVAGPRHVIDAVELDVARPGDLRRELAPGAPVDHSVAVTV